MKILQRILFTVLLCIFIVGGLGYFAFTSIIKSVTPQTSQKSSLADRKNEILNVISQNAITPPPDETKIETAQLKGIVASLEDPYTEYQTAEEYTKFRNGIDEKYEGIGIKFVTKPEGYTITKVLKNSPALNAGLAIGDIIKKVDTADLASISFDEIAKKIRGASGSIVTLEILRGTETKSFPITRGPIANELVTLDVKGNTGVITITSFGSNVGNLFNGIARQIKENPSINRLVLDLRSNSGGLLQESINIASILQENDQIVVKETSKKGNIELKTSKSDISLSDLPLIIVVDPASASASEILAGSLRDNRNIQLVGQKTYGKGVVQSLYPLKNGDTIKLTTAEWFTPKGSKINKTGLQPDVKVADTEDSLAKAVEIIQK
jgi:carboxyl-terminal processing protease